MELLLQRRFESAPKKSDRAGKQGGQLLLSQLVQENAVEETKQSPYSLLRTTEDLFGLSNLGMAAPSSTPSFVDPLLGVSGGD